MSQILQLEIKLTNPEHIRTACKVLKYKLEEDVDVKIWSHKVCHGSRIELPGWRHPVCVENDGTVQYDNYDGEWGDMNRLHDLTRRYGAENTKKVLVSHGYSVHEQVDENSDILLTADKY